MAEKTDFPIPLLVDSYEIIKDEKGRIIRLEKIITREDK